MAGRELSLFLKYPGSGVALQRLQHSFLECVVEHKSGSPEELVACPPSYLKSDYQLKGTASLEEDELVISFTPKHVGLHTVRLFADTRELCKPVAFVVSQGGEIESTPIDKPLRQTSSLFRQVTPSPAPSSGMQNQPFQPQQQQRVSQPLRTAQPVPQPQQGYEWGGEAGESADNMSPSHQQQSPQQQHQDVDGFYRHRFTSDPPTMLNTRQSQPTYQGGGAGASHHYQQQRFSHMTAWGATSRPASMMPDEQGYAGDLLSMTAEKSSFDQLHARKVAGEAGAKVRQDFLMVDHRKVVTPNTFESLNRDIGKLVGKRGMKTRRR